MFKNPNLYRVLFVISILVFGYTVFDYYTYTNQRAKKAIELGKSKNHEVKLLLDSASSVIVDLTAGLAKKVSEKSYSKEELFELIIKTTNTTTLGLGATVAYEPFKLNEDIRLFSPYYDRNLGKVIDIAEVYDYTEKGLATTAWYTDVIEDNKPIWSEPYFAQGAQQMVIDYGMPFYLTNSKGKEEVGGMVSFTISLERFSAYVNGLSLGKSGYGYLSTKEMHLITHPKTEFINNPAVITRKI